ncbi:MAG: hypothetical protein NZM12_12985 [Steroidobacteraceae bacterium]|nr:hypothetical protein [Steroidobacteraceae bacterium]MDW8260159.1 FAD-dependent oxidoreductase [Gammaproteobacteria bacterium]
MSEIIVCGAGVIGLAVATLLARDGHRVTVLERDAAPVPESVEDAWCRWERRSVPQFRQPHNLLPRYRQILEQDLPDVFDALLAAGGTWVNMLERLPPTIADREPRAGDDRFRFVTARRPTVEYVHARAAENEPRVTVRRGVKIEGFTFAPRKNGIPHVTGVRTSDGDMHADLVIDAMGRRSPGVDWLIAAGARSPITQSQECAFVYYTQYFRGPRFPDALAPTVSPIGTFMILTMRGDNSTWSVTLWAPSTDKPLKAFRDPEKFARVVRACPLHAHWLDGEPISTVLPMGGILDRYRRFVIDGEPIATGIVAVGDAWACTNPSAGRGLSVGLLHAQRLRDVLRSAFGDARRLALEWDAVTERELAPWYWAQLASDQARLEQITAVREGRAPAVRTLLPLPPAFEAAGRAMAHDADVFRAVMETVGCLALPEEVFARPGLWDKVQAAAREAPTLPGPSRTALLELLA